MKTHHVPSLLTAALFLLASPAGAEPAKDPKAPAPAENAAPAKKTPAKKAAPKTETPSETKDDATKDDAKKDDASKGALPAAADKTDEAAKDANESIVGSDAQSENERQAQDAKLRPKTDKESKDAAQKVGKATTTAAETVGTAVQDTTRSLDAPGKYNPVAVSLNPLGLFVGGRFSITGEWAPVTHHVIALSPHVVNTSADIAVSANNTQSQTYSGFGGEVGYRYYTGHKGMNGVFVGPSLIGGVYNASLPGRDQAFTNIGVAADIGLKYIAWEHLALGGGVGLQYLNVSEDFGDVPNGPSQIAETGIKPRLLFEAGYAF